MQFAPPALDGLSRKRPSIEPPLMPTLSTDGMNNNRIAPTIVNPLIPLNFSINAESHKAAVPLNDNRSEYYATPSSMNIFCLDEMQEMGRLLERFRSRYLQLANQYSSSQQDLSIFQTRLVESDRRLMEEQSTIGRAYDTIKELQSLGSTLSNRVSMLADLKSSINEKSNSIEELVKSMQEMKLKMSEKLLRLEADRKQLGEEIRVLKTEMGNIIASEAKKIDELKTENCRLSTCLTETTQNRDSLIIDIDQLQKSKQDQCQLLTENVDQLMNELDLKRREISEFKAGIAKIINQIAENMECRPPTSFGNGGLEAIGVVMEELAAEHLMMDIGRERERNEQISCLHEEFTKIKEELERTKKSLDIRQCEESNTEKRVKNLESKCTSKIQYIKKLEDRISEMQIESANNAVKLSELQKIRVISNLVSEVIFERQEGNMEYEDMKSVLVEKLSHNQCKEQLQELETNYANEKSEKQKLAEQMQKIRSEAAQKEKILQDKITLLVGQIENHEIAKTVVVRDKTVDGLIELIERDTQELKIGCDCLGWNMLAEVVLLVAFAMQAIALPEVHKGVYRKLEKKPKSVFLVTFKPADLQLAHDAEYMLRIGKLKKIVLDMPINEFIATGNYHTARGEYVFDTITEHHRKTSKLLKKLVPNVAISSSIPISNSFLIVTNKDDLKKLETSDDVVEIHTNDGFRVDLPTVKLDRAMSATKPDIPGRLVGLVVEGEENRSRNLQWNIAKIGADNVWNMDSSRSRGQGIVYAIADTGVAYTHPNINANYIGRKLDGSYNHNYAWYDGVRRQFATDGPNICGFGSNIPCDDQGHGTHVTSTGVGQNGYGVAPGAKWMACRNMDRGVGSPETYLNCLNFFLAPHDLNGRNPRPNLRPHVVGNSYGCPDSEGCGKHAMTSAMEALRAAGVFMSVSAGNEGPGCGTIADPPALERSVISVGATDSNDNLAQFSSRGPCRLDSQAYRKPDVSAPGVRVLAAYPGDSYRALSGTSMASPHVGGAAVLISAMCPLFVRNVDLIQDVLQRTARPLTPPPGEQLCGRDSYDSVPNNFFGYGRIDVYAAVKKCREVCESWA